jgi:hypothetical protein
VPGTCQTLHIVLSGQLAPERGLVEPVDEGPLAVDLDHRQPLTVLRLELGIAGDVDLPVVELDLGAQRGELPPRALAQVAAVRFE